MGKLTPEQQAQLDELNALAEAPDDDDEEYEIEIYSSDGSGARLPYKKGKSWLAKTFGIDIGDAPAPTEPKSATTRKAKATPDKDDSGDEPQTQGLKLFRQQQGQGRGKAS